MSWRERIVSLVYSCIGHFYIFHIIKRQTTRKSDERNEQQRRRRRTRSGSGARLLRKVESRSLLNPEGNVTISSGTLCALLPGRRRLFLNKSRSTYVVRRNARARRNKETGIIVRQTVSNRREPVSGFFFLRDIIIIIIKRKLLFFAISSSAQ